MNTTGLLVDRDRVDRLTNRYIEVKNRLGSSIRKWARWESLNLESRFQVAELLFGEVEDLREIGDPPDVRADAGWVDLGRDAAHEVARRSRGTPRIANRLLRRVRDYADVKAAGVVSADTADKAMDMLSVDSNGFDIMDRKLLLAIINNFEGGPVGVDNLAAAIGEERGTIEDVIEPYLIMEGFIMRTPRGRVATQSAYTHFGLKPKSVPDEKE